MKMYASSNIGLGRTVNQDAYYVPKPGERFALVADGMGGHQAGEVASRIAVDEFSKWLRCAPRPSEEALHRAVAEANIAIYKEGRGDSAKSGMGTTLTALWFGEDFVYLAHIGDSRAYLLRNGAMMQLSSDHTLVGEMLARGQITSHEAMVHPHRHYITRALGTAPSVEPDILRLNYRPDDVWLLCSDGLSNYVRSHEMADLLSRPTSWEARVESLIELALKRGGSDNITALVVASEEVGV
ncbi:MAG: Stp1/IreP family PP2C-type Ser/Thr phosphatase [Clostridiales bacterium]|nr:Stp1/IreP family PP2C-type Ser/Thr phosphatase [Clostridiales bacterium]